MEAYAFVMPDVEQQLAAFLDKYEPRVRAVALRVREAMAARYPGAVQMVYDNYNALVIGFGPSERVSDAVFSFAVYPRWVTFFFLQGATLADPKKLLGGEGKIVRHLRLEDADDLDKPDVKKLMAAAVKQSETPFPKSGGRVVIKSISAKQRARRPL